MNKKTGKTIGILGGMGPEATLALYKLIIDNTPAKKDQDHIHVIINSNPAIPDRTLHIVYGQESPLPLLKEGALLLEKAGAQMILIPCNTAHYFVPEISKAIKIPILNMLDITCKYIALQAKKLPEYNGASKIPVGILATTGTIKTALYQNYLEKQNLEYIIPTEQEQESIVMEAIYGKRGVKAGYHKEPAQLLKQAAILLIDRGAKFIIAGCTEVPLVLTHKMVSVPLVNSMEVVAKEAIRVAKGNK
ncbi:MAG: amino acid racemase [Bacteroidales bacterium]|nr:amino acid racemase [Bacteroidales bacterium]MDD4657111.1 amino acid racemase [Bacteroidales bacterium]